MVAASICTIPYSYRDGKRVYLGDVCGREKGGAVGKGEALREKERSSLGRWSLLLISVYADWRSVYIQLRPHRQN